MGKGIHENLKEMRAFVRENDMTYNEFFNYVIENNNKEWEYILGQRGISKRFSNYCKCRKYSKKKS